MFCTKLKKKHFRRRGVSLSPTATEKSDTFPYASALGPGADGTSIDSVAALSGPFGVSRSPLF